MFKEAVANRVNWLIGMAVFSVTLAVSPATTLDPINLPKFWVLLAISVAVSAVLLTQPKALFSKSNLQVFVSVRAVFVCMTLTLVFSSISLSQQLFGVYGRNTGLLTYFAFGSLFVGTALATSKKLIRPLILGTTSALALNALYGVLQANGGDPIKWSNPYAPVIGTLGNPNFVAAFLGMGVAFALTYLIAPAIDVKYRIASGFYILLATYDILKSDAQQGIVVALLSVGLIFYFYMKYKLSNLITRLSYLGFGLIATIVGILGFLQKGPLASFLYKPSVTFRGDYWQAGIEMFKSHPWFGVGLDAYGDYYRASRTIEATLRRGPSTVSNAAHNVFIDIAATAGIFALLAYLAMIFIGLRAAWRISKRTMNFDPFFVSVFVAWVWVLPGVLIAIDRWHSEEKPKVKETKTTDFTGMAMIAGLVVGGIIGYLPFNADANFRYSLESADPVRIYEGAKKWPLDTARLNYASRIFEQNKVSDKAINLAREAVKLSPRNFDAWMYLYNAPSVSGNEKREILDRLKALDPHNPDLKKLG
jgi:O-antigen ligase